MDLLAEVEVGGDRVLEEMNTEVADEDEEEGVGRLGALRQHAHEGRGQHEARAQRHEVAQGGLAPAVGGGHDRGAREIRGRRDGHECPLC